jgi:hypothetical protein
MGRINHQEDGVQSFLLYFTTGVRQVYLMQILLKALGGLFRLMLTTGNLLLLS